MSKNVDMVNHPPHYTKYPVECIEIMEDINNSLLANAFKYAWRIGDKGSVVEDLGKIDWYMKRYINQEEIVKSKRSVEESFELLKKDGKMLPKKMTFLEAVYNFSQKKGTVGEVMKARKEMEEELQMFYSLN